jgi:hypothetical protein
MGPTACWRRRSWGFPQSSTMLRDHADWSNRRIAELCGLSDKTLAKLRGRATADLRQSSNRVGRDGRRRPTDPAAARQRIAEYLARHPHCSDRAVAEAVTTSQATVRDVRQRLARGEGPLPERLQTPSVPARDERAGPEESDAASLVDDSALSSTPEGREFVRWWAARRVGGRDWSRFVGSIALSRIYVVAEEARRQAANWTSFADALEARVDSRPGSSTSMSELDRV